MRTYTRFERLMGVYANRSHVPLPWITFEVTDKLYGMPVDPKTGTTLTSAARPTLVMKEVITTNNGRPPLIPVGRGISPSHSLWTIGVEPGDGGTEMLQLVNDDQHNEDTQRQGGEGSAGEHDVQHAFPNPAMSENGYTEHTSAGDGYAHGSTGAVVHDHHVGAATAPPEGINEGEGDASTDAGIAEDDGYREEEDATPNSLQDVWVDSYLSCAADECFVCVRDKRSTRGEAALSGAWRAVDVANGGHGEYGYFGGDSNLPCITDENDPGQPVRPPHAGWLFRVKADAPLEPVIRCIHGDLTGGTLAEGTYPVTCAAIHLADTEGNSKPMFSDSDARLDPPADALVPQANEHICRGNSALQFANGEDPSAAGPSVASMLFHFVAVAPHFSDHLATAYPTDTPALAAERAAATLHDARVRRRPQPMYILEVHDLESYVGRVWAGRYATRGR